MPPAIVIVVAIAENGVIGRDGGMPWRLPTDLKHFKAATLGKPVIFGRKTFAGLGRPQPGRLNIVVTRDRAYAAPGALVAPSLDAALQAAAGEALRRGGEEIIVAGGGDLYAQALPRSARLLVTEIAARPEGDVCFPPIDCGVWAEVAREGPLRNAGDEAAVSFVTYQKI